MIWTWYRARFQNRRTGIIHNDQRHFVGKRFSLFRKIQPPTEERLWLEARRGKFPFPLVKFALKQNCSARLGFWISMLIKEQELFITPLVKSSWVRSQWSWVQDIKKRSSGQLPIMNKRMKQGKNALSSLSHFRNQYIKRLEQSLLIPGDLISCSSTRAPSRARQSLFALNHQVPHLILGEGSKQGHPWYWIHQQLLKKAAFRCVSKSQLFTNSIPEKYARCKDFINYYLIKVSHNKDFINLDFLSTSWYGYITPGDEEWKSVRLDLLASAHMTRCIPPSLWPRQGVHCPGRVSCIPPFDSYPT